MRITDQYFWNLVFWLFFGILLVMATIILETESRIAFSDLSLVDYLLIVLSGWRLMRLFVYDSTTRFIREQFWDVDKVGKSYQLQKPKVGSRRTIADLLDCPWSFGLWSVSVVTFFYLITPYAVFPIMILALSAVATFMQSLSESLERRF